MPVYYSQIENEHLLLIGKIVAECGYLESLIQALIWKIAHIKSISGRAITTNVGLREKVHILSALSSVHYEKGTELDNEIQWLAKEINEIAAQRNKLVHNPWASAGIKGYSTSAIFKTRGKLKVEIMKTGTKDLQDLLKKISTTCDIIDRIILEYF